MSYNRRKFLKSSAAGLLGALTLSEPLLASASLKSKTWPVESDESYWEFLKSQFSLLDGLRYFNNGSLGPSPEYVIDRTEKFRRMLDAYPSKYMWGGWNKEKEEVRSKLADLLGADSEEIAIIHNTSEGMNLFARSFDFKAGDEIILADHEHRTGVAPYEYFCESRGIKLVRPKLPILPESKEELVEVYKAAITDKTRLISMVHMTNTNGMILPVKEISELAHKENIPVCVDAAQSIAHLDTKMEDLGCDFYAASGHKWLWGPKGTGVLYARKEMQHMLKPLMVSNSWKEVNIRMFEDYNTRNLPEVLGLGAAVDFNNLIRLKKKEDRIYSLKWHFRDQLENDSRFIFKTPGPDELSAGIQVLEMKGHNVVDASRLLNIEFSIDCRPMTGHNLNALRISLSPFNTLADIDYLVESLKSFA